MQFTQFQSRWQGHVICASVQLACSLVLTSTASAQLQSIESVSTSGALSNGQSTAASISKSGNRVVFSSRATNLDPAATNAKWHAFLRDRNTQTTTLLDTSAQGVQADNGVVYAVLAANGDHVAFSSAANNLPGGSTGTKEHIYQRDLATGTIVRVSHAFGSTAQPNGSCTRPATSNDGEWIAFDSTATDILAPGVDPARRDVFLWRRSNTSIIPVSCDSSGLLGNNDSYDTSVSGDGSRIVFESTATNLAGSDNNHVADIFLRVRQPPSTHLVSVTPGGSAGNNRSYAPKISDDGRYVAFYSYASDLVPNDINGKPDAFVRDLQTGITTRVSVSTLGVEANGPSGTYGVAILPGISISEDGRFVAFHSSATNLDPNDTDFISDTFLRDTREQSTTLISQAADGWGANGGSYRAALDRTATIVVYDSDATNIVAGDGNGQADILLRRFPAAHPVHYGTAKVNSLACTPRISSSGMPSTSLIQAFSIYGQNVRNNKPGLLLYGMQGRHAVALGGGTLYVKPPVYRTIPANSGGNAAPLDDCSGIYKIDMNSFAHGLLGGSPQPALFVYGQTVNCQWWGRDPGFSAPNNVTLTDGLEYVVGL